MTSISLKTICLLIISFSIGGVECANNVRKLKSKWSVEDLVRSSQVRKPCYKVRFLQHSVRVYLPMLDPSDFSDVNVLLYTAQTVVYPYPTDSFEAKEVFCPTKDDANMTQDNNNWLSPKPPHKFNLKVIEGKREMTDTSVAKSHVIILDPTNGQVKLSEKGWKVLKQQIDSGLLSVKKNDDDVLVEIQFVIQLFANEGLHFWDEMNFSLAILKQNQLCDQPYKLSKFLTFSDYKYSVPENLATELTLGFFSSPMWIDIIQKCLQKSIRVDCEADNNYLKDPRGFLEMSGNELKLLHPLDREIFGNFKVEFSCNITQEQDLSSSDNSSSWHDNKILRHFKKNIYLQLEDQNDNSPFPQDNPFVIEVIPEDDNYILRPKHNVFYDADLPSSNVYFLQLPNNSAIRTDLVQLGVYSITCSSSTSFCPCIISTKDSENDVPMSDPGGENKPVVAASYCTFNGSALYIQQSKLYLAPGTVLDDNSEIMIQAKLFDAKNPELSRDFPILLKKVKSESEEETTKSFFDERENEKNGKDGSNRSMRSNKRIPDDSVNLHNSSVTISKSLTKYSRVFEINKFKNFSTPTTIRFEKIFWEKALESDKSLVVLQIQNTPFSMTNENQNGDISSNDILYVQRPEYFSRFGDGDKIKIWMKTGNDEIESVTLLLTVTISDDPLVTPKRKKNLHQCEGNPSEQEMTCSEFSVEDECKRTCGVGAVKGLCQWVRENRTEGRTYSTCSVDSVTCPDNYCDPLERIDSADICPQDCTSKDNLRGNPLLFNKNSGEVEGIGSIKIPNLICTCQGYDCSCLKKTLAHPLYKDDHEDDYEDGSNEVQPNKTKTVSSDPPWATTSVTNQSEGGCDASCIIGVVIAIAVLKVAAITFTIVLRRRWKKRNPSTGILQQNRRLGWNPQTAEGSSSYLAQVEEAFLQHQRRTGTRRSNATRSFIDSASSVGTRNSIRPNKRRHSSHFHCPSASLSGTSTGTATTTSMITVNTDQDESVFSLISGEQIERDLMHAPIDRKWEFPRKNLILEETVGEGEFGKVMSARAMDKSHPQGYRRVAVKMLKAHHSREELHDLISEFNLLKEVDHPNVIKLIGACTSKGGPLCIIVEYAQHGSLRDYLRSSRGLSNRWPKKPSIESNDSGSLNFNQQDGLQTFELRPREILTYAWQVAKGMNYLAGMKMVHRDLAARNVLLAEGMICKVSDFGLTRDVYIDDAYWKKSNGRIPVKWMAPESLRDHLYTSKSDVWSFGVLLWELVTLGSAPYPGILPERLLHLLTIGYRMDKPANCTPEIYSIMMRCWELVPDNRPAFKEIINWLETVLQSSAEYLELTQNTVNNATYLQPHSSLDSFSSLLVHEDSDDPSVWVTEAPPLIPNYARSVSRPMTPADLTDLKNEKKLQRKKSSRKTLKTQDEIREELDENERFFAHLQTYVLSENQTTQQDSGTEKAESEEGCSSSPNLTPKLERKVSNATKQEEKEKVQYSTVQV